MVVADGRCYVYFENHLFRPLLCPSRQSTNVRVFLSDRPGGTFLSYLHQQFHWVSFGFKILYLTSLIIIATNQPNIDLNSMAWFDPSVKIV